MRTLTSRDALHVLEDVTAWAACWKLTKADEILRQTNHDRELIVSLSSDPKGLNGVYSPFLAFDGTTLRNASDLAVDNLEVDTVLDELGITAADVRAGLFDDIRYVIFIVNWKDPTDSGIILKAGLVGNIRTFARDVANAELRGLKQYLQQTIVETYGPGCKADLGDARCGVNLAPLTLTGTVTAVLGARLQFTASGIGQSPEDNDYWVGGLVTWLTGNNATYSMEVRADTDGGTITLFEPMPRDIQVGDTFTIYPGCNKIHHVSDEGVVTGDCKNKFNNVVNFQGVPFIPGTNELVRGPE